MSIYTIKFYLILLKETLLLPFLYGHEFLKKKTHNYHLFALKQRKPIESKKLYVCIHEWGGYDLKRQKHINKIKPFECGLYYQLERFDKFNKTEEINIELTITLSDVHLYKHKDYLASRCNRIIEVNNNGFDFSGYAVFFDSIKDKPNNYVILSNSSVNSDINNFIGKYIEYMENNKDVGILGTSYSTKMQQTFIRNNFTPHIQSFFFLTTIDVLKEIVRQNGNKFPGKGIDHKLLLIREGEIKISQIALNLNYSLAVVLENGNIFKFNKGSKKENCCEQWKDMPKGDYRTHVEYPNKINLIKERDRSG